ncbi:MAG TPA: rhomboid family intramembrane serine protease [Pseudomonadales bacterium]|nr:rhomboid family intramembrane serine protease [Pseudomonadales bacterium]
MTELIEVLRAPVDQDLAPFCRYLRSENIFVYVFEREGEQCVCVPADVSPARLHILVERWSSGAVDVALYAQDGASVSPANPTVFALWRHFPLTLLLILLSTVTFIMVATPWGNDMGGMAVFYAFSFQSFRAAGDDLMLLQTMPSLAECWRFWTPMFLHFTVLHILSNSLLLLEFGRRVESVQGSMRLLFLVMACGLFSNLAQVFMEPGTPFGGMSGVVFGLVSYCWLYRRLKPGRGIDAPAGLIVIALIWLVMGMVGVVSLASPDQRIANAAHIGGLLSGLVFAALLAFLDRAPPSSGMQA